MIVGLNDEQRKFLTEKFGITANDIARMDVKGWSQIREKCFEIETDELLEADDPDECNTEAYRLAASVIDANYTEGTDHVKKRPAELKYPNNTALQI